MEASVATRPFAGLGRHISHSQVSTIDRCELVWWFKYVRGITKPPTIHMVLGQCYHKALAFNFEQKMLTGIDLPASEVIDCFNSSFVRSGPVEGVDGEAYRAPVERVLSHYYTEYVVGKMEPILVEHEFTRSIPGCDRPYAGIVDVQLSDGRMIDFKVTGRRWQPSNVADMNQASAYAMLYGYDTDFEFHIGLRANKKPAIQVVKLQRTKDDVNQYVCHLRQVLLRVRELENGAGPVPKDGYCNEGMCQYYSECCRWKYGGDVDE